MTGMRTTNAAPGCQDGDRRPKRRTRVRDMFEGMVEPTRSKEPVTSSSLALRTGTPWTTRSFSMKGSMPNRFVNPRARRTTSRSGARPVPRAGHPRRTNGPPSAAVTPSSERIPLAPAQCVGRAERRRCLVLSSPAQRQAARVGGQGALPARHRPRACRSGIGAGSGGPGRPGSPRCARFRRSCSGRRETSHVFRTSSRERGKRS